MNERKHPVLSDNEVRFFKSNVAIIVKSMKESKQNAVTMPNYTRWLEGNYTGRLRVLQSYYQHVKFGIL